MTARVIVEADGGSRGNPGPAGCGAVVLDADTRAVLAERAIGLGETTNNVAEYRGLIAGLTAARELGAAEVSVRMDSKLVVEQMAGRWKVKHVNLQPLHAEARELATEFAHVDYEWIPRAENSAADKLANDAMDGKTAETGQVAEAGQVTETESAAARTRPSGWQNLRGAPTKILLLRHGQTAMSVDKRYSGRGDVDLTELGERQVRAAGKRLAAMDGVVTSDGPAPIIASPLARTRQSAQAVADATGSEVELHDGLIETDFGAWEGLTFLEAADEYPDLHRRWIGDPTVEPPDGESLEAVHQRVTAARDDLVERYAGKTIIVVSHVTPIKSLLRTGLGVGAEIFYRLHLDLASLSIVEFYPDDNASVRLVNDISHWA
ncbi:bifunctional RNase H/acid phosphatase [Saccharopolyspora tripterygii]